MNTVLIPTSKEEIERLCKSTLDSTCSLTSLPDLLMKDLFIIYEEITGCEVDNFVYGITEINGNVIDLDKDYKSVSSYLKVGSESYILQGNIREDRLIKIDYLKLISIKNKYKKLALMSEEVIPIKHDILFEELRDMINEDNINIGIAFINPLEPNDISYYIEIDNNWDYDEQTVSRDAKELYKSFSF